MSKRTRIQKMVCVVVMIAGSASAGMLVLADTLPSVVPDDFKSWPVQAILGLITMTSLGMMFFSMCKGNNVITQAGIKAAELQVTIHNLCEKIDKLLEK